MSLSIDIGKVTAVLLADGWHQVHHRSFNLDAFEFEHDGHNVHGGGQRGVSATGFAFDEGGALVAGPLTSVLALRYSA